METFAQNGGKTKEVGDGRGGGKSGLQRIPITVLGRDVRLVPM